MNHTQIKERAHFLMAGFFYELQPLAIPGQKIIFEEFMEAYENSYF